MIRMLQIIAATVIIAGAGPAALAARSGDDAKETVESRLLRILKDRGVLKDSEYEELVKLGQRMRAEEAMTSSALEKELLELAERVASQAEAKKTTPDVKITYKHGKGFTFAQGDDFSMTIGGRLQARASYLAPDGKSSAGQDDRLSNDVRRARIAFDGHVLEKALTYKFQLDAAPAASVLRDAYMNYQFAPEVQLRAGQMKRPFSRQNWVSSGDFQFPERASVVERFRSIAGDRDVGLLTWGEIGESKQFEWYAGVFNGDGLNNGAPNAVSLGPSSTGLNVANASNNDSSGVEAVVRLAWNPAGPPGYSEGDLDLTDTPKFGLGIQFDHNPERRGNPLGIGGIPAANFPQYNVQTYGGDAILKYMGLFMTAEAYHREISPSGRLDDVNIFNTATESGWFAQGGYFFGQEKQKGPEIAARYAQIDFDQNIAPAGPGGSTKIDDLTVAFSYYFVGHALKLQAAYTYRVDRLRGIDPHNEHQVFQIQAQMKF